MKLFKLAAILLALSSAALAQVTLQCTSFPCSLQITTVQCPSGFPCAVTITIPPKFNVGDKVTVVGASSGLAVRSTAAFSGTLLGTQPNGRTGTITAGAVLDATGDNKVRYQIDYAIGFDGWSIQDFLVKAASPANKFAVGDRVAVIPDGPANPGGNISIRAIPVTASALLGVQGPGALGTVIGGPTLDPADNSIRYNINYDTGVDGWSLDVYLAKSSIPPPVTKSVQLTWVAPATDGAASYNLYRGGVNVGTVSGSTLTFTNAAVSSGTYMYTARTVDSSGRESANSNVVTVVVP